MNLLSETVGVMNNYGKKPEDVVQVMWLNTPNESVYEGCSWEDFAEAARTIDYNNGWLGSHDIEESLIILFDDYSSWLERYEYDGSVDWDYKKCPGLAERLTSDVKAIRKKLVTRMYECGEEGEYVEN